MTEKSCVAVIYASNQNILVYFLFHFIFKEFSISSARILNSLQIYDGISAVVLI